MPLENVHYRTCNLCEAMCGIQIRHRGGEIISIRGDKNDPFSKGHICPKAVALQDLHNDPDRLRRPLKKHQGEFVEIEWDEAIEETAYRINQIQSRYGKNSFATYIGNPTAHNHGLLMFAGPLLLALNSRNRFSATSVDQLPHMLVAMEMFGSHALLPVTDMDNVEYLVCIGGNPVASMGSLMTAPDMKGRLKSISQQGGKVVVIDPRKTETADIANEHYFIKPGTDAFLVASLLQVIFSEPQKLSRRLMNMLEGLDQLASLVEGFTPEYTELLTGVSALAVRQMARELLSAKTGVVYSRLGTCAQEYGTVTNWLIMALNVITGNFDRKGGLMFPRAAIDLSGVANLVGQTGSFGRFNSRVSGLPEFGGEFPVVTLAEEILTPGEGQIRGLMTVAGNPVLSTPNGRQLDKAFDHLDFMVSADIFLNESSRHADIILPGTGQLEHSHFDIVFNAIAVRNTVKYSPALFDPAPGSMHDADILQSLTANLLRKKETEKTRNKVLARLLESLSVDGMLDLGIRLGPYGSMTAGVSVLDTFLHHRAGALFKRGLAMGLGVVAKNNKGLGHALDTLSVVQTDRPLNGLTLNKVKQFPHGIDLGPLEPSCPERLATKNKKIQLAPALFVDEFTRIKEKLSQSTTGDEQTGLALIGRRHVRSCNSWMHNSNRLVKGKNRCTLMIHPEDAKQKGIDDGALVKVSSRVGSIEIEAQVTESVMQGVVSIPHGWGHDREGSRLSVAQDHAGVSINDVMDEKAIEALTGVAMLNGSRVSVEVIGTTKGMGENQLNTSGVT